MKIYDQISRELHIKEGERTSDNRFSIESVRCLGCCGLAPVVTVGKNLHGKIPVAKVNKILQQYK
jgi:NADH:ubiquinone oxidoreductase subunit E